MNLFSSIQQILESFLGNGIYNSRNNECTFFCPNCHHRKRKLSINLQNGCWHCWVCNIRSRSISNLILSYGSSSQLRQYQEIISESNNKFENKNNGYKYFDDLLISVEEKLSIINQDITQKVELPCGFKYLTEKSIHPDHYKIMEYLYSREITDELISIFNIGWTELEEYRAYSIIPSYNIQGDLNYYVGRLVYEIEERQNNKYLNCNISKSDIIPFELYVDWNREITLVEGVFDFMKHYHHNVIPLLGNNLSTLLLNKLIKLNQPVFVMLDNDMKSKAINICEFLNSFKIESYFVDISQTEYKDPGCIPVKNFLDTRNDCRKEVDIDLIIKCKFGM